MIYLLIAIILGLGTFSVILIIKNKEKADIVKRLMPLSVGTISECESLQSIVKGKMMAYSCRAIANKLMDHLVSMEVGAGEKFVAEGRRVMKAINDNYLVNFDILIPAIYRVKLQTFMGDESTYNEFKVSTMAFIDTEICENVVLTLEDQSNIAAYRQIHNPNVMFLLRRIAGYVDAPVAHNEKYGGIAMDEFYMYVNKLRV